MTVLTISTMHNETLITASKPVSRAHMSKRLVYDGISQAIILPPSSRLLSFMSSAPRELEFVLPMLSSFYAEVENLRARVEIGRRDGWKSLGHGEGRELSVIASAIRGEVRPHGIK